MQLTHVVVLVALILATMIITGYARGAGTSPELREAQRRLAVAEHQRRKDDFVRRCSKVRLSPAELEACRAAYRKL
jgi:hypothetical protein